MFMRYRGGGVGHLGTRDLDSRLKGDIHELACEEQDEVSEVIAGLSENGNSESFPARDRWEAPVTHEERASQREPSNDNGKEVETKGDSDDEDEDEDNDEDEDGYGDNEDEDEDEAQEVLGNASDEQDLDDEDEEAMNDADVLAREGFGEL
jgi:hypothetical protein